ncbi:hypothetical protein BDD26_2423 [Xenorhabdus cabanillasii]|uniref:Uncharacterized protein n=1 Tax=Xenorhabdus cabanillasii TaxID=351673 RepID=A0A3D9UEB5_9GAMM|nr:hypothetical protein [Xenorhabdus cabanillasii]REF27616.1 hypothetical protein BDD26_2423 [Xenorhabdus cabanillasii]
MTDTQEKLNTNQKILKAELISHILLQEIIILMDYMNGDNKASNLIIKKLEGMIEFLPESSAKHDPAVMKAYQDALDLVKLAQKQKNALRKSRE